MRSEHRLIRLVKRTVHRFQILQKHLPQIKYLLVFLLACAIQQHVLFLSRRSFL